MTIRKKDTKGHERRGEIDLGTGKNEILVKVKTYGDEEIDWKLIECEDHSTCSSLSENLVEIIMHHEGFIIKTDIESNSIKFNWWIK